MFWTIVAAILFVLFLIHVVPFILVCIGFSIASARDWIRDYFRKKAEAREYLTFEDASYKAFNAEIREHSKRRRENVKRRIK